MAADGCSSAIFAGGIAQMRQVCMSEDCLQINWNHSGCRPVPSLTVLMCAQVEDFDSEVMQKRCTGRASIARWRLLFRSSEIIQPLRIPSLMWMQICIASARRAESDEAVPTFAIPTDVLENCTILDTAELMSHESRYIIRSTESSETCARTRIQLY